jgi:protein TonB
MLEQLVVSSSQRKAGRKFRGFLVGTAALVLAGCFSVFVWSIMAAELALTDDGLELSAFIAPVPIPAAEPPKPEPEQQPERQQTAKNEITTRQAVIDRIDDSRVIPDQISTTPNTQKERPKDGVKYKLSSGPEVNGGNLGRSDGGDIGGPSDPGGIAGNGSDIDRDKPPVMPKKDPEPVKREVVKTGGVLNGVAKFLPKPGYPTAAKAMNISDSVSVQVVVDEQGNVISAKAVSGNRMLRQVSEQAARQAKFGPTYLTGQAVKVTGIIVYKFVSG